MNHKTISLELMSSDAGAAPLERIPTGAREAREPLLATRPPGCSRSSRLRFGWGAMSLCLAVAGPGGLASPVPLPTDDPGRGCGGEAVVYETGFERSDGFRGSTRLDGQKGWLVGNGTNTWVMSGYQPPLSQCVFMGGPQESGSLGPIVHPPVHFPDGGTSDPVRLRVLVAVFDSTPGTLDRFTWRILGQGRVLGSVSFGAGTLRAWVGETPENHAASGTYTGTIPGDLVIEVHPAMGHWSAWWDGTLIADRLPLGGSGQPARISGFEVGLQLADPSKPGGGFMLFDRYRVARLSASPKLRNLPQAQHITPGNEALLRVTADGTPPFDFQWYRNGTRLPGGTGPELLLRDQRFADTADYHVVITNQFGLATSPAARVTVVAPERNRAWAFNRLAGQAGEAGSTDGPGATARFGDPEDVAFDASDNAYVADAGNHTIRRITPAGVVTTFAGTPGSGGHRDGPAASALFRMPEGVAVDPDGNVIVADTWNHVIRRIGRDGMVTTLAGTVGTLGAADGVGAAASFYSPRGVAVDARGNILVADLYNHTIRKVAPNRTVTTLAGTVAVPGFANGKGREALFYLPSGIALDRAGIAYVADSWNQCLRRIQPDGTVTTLAGTPGVAGFADGPAGCNLFQHPSRIAVAADGRCFVTDEQARLVRAVDTDGQVATLGGRPSEGGMVDGVGSTARFALPRGIAIDRRGRLLVADRAAHRVVQAVPPDPSQPSPTLLPERRPDGIQWVIGDEEGSWLEILEAPNAIGPWEVRWSGALGEPTMKWHPTAPLPSGAGFYRVRRR